MKYLFLLIILFLLPGCESPNDHQRLSLQGRTMGTTYQVDIIQTDKTIDEDGLADGIRARLEFIEQSMSNWREDSEISQFNRLPAENSRAFTEDTFKVVALAQSISKQTGGAFDITVSPLIELWGFGTKITPPTIPDPKQISHVLQRVGYKYLSLIPETRVITKHKSLTLNLSAIAKGYAVDEVADYLHSQGITRFLVEIGGEIRASGLKLDNTPWKIAIEQPLYSDSSLNRKARQIISLTDMAIATSGDYRNYFTIEGERYSHIIDPMTGWPVKHNLVSVSVIDQNAARADALATAFTVMGIEKSITFCEKNKIAAYFIYEDQGQYNKYITLEFKKYLTMSVD